MAVTNFSPLLGFALPTTGDLDGTWGTTVNDSITQLLDSAIAGTTTLSADADVTLTTTNGAANQARNAVILWTASNGATTRNITAPAQSKAYVVINAGTGSIVIRGAGPTTGVTVPAGARALVAWNGSDFVKVASSAVSLTTDVSGVLPEANGGTGESTYTDGQLLIGNTAGGLTKATITAGSNISVTNGNGSISIAATGLSSGDVVGPASATDSALTAFDGTTGKLIKQAATVTTAQGGTGATTYTDGQLLIGNTAGGLTKATITAGSNISITNGNGSISIAATGLAAGDVVGPASATDGAVVAFDGVTGKLIKQATVTGTGNVVLATSPTLVTPALGTPASGVLSNTTVDGTNKVGYLNIPYVADKTTSYSLATGDIGEVVGVGTGGSITIPDATFAAGDAVLVFNNTSGSITITCTITTAYIAGTDADKATVTLATRGLANILFISGTVCVITGNVS